MAAAERPGRRGRGQSEVLGVVLLLALTITGTGLIVAFGSSALSDSRQSSEIASAEHAMTQLDSKASLVGVGSSPAQSVSLGVDGTTRVENESGWMRVVIDPLNESESDATVMNRTLGAVVYENGDAVIAYQGGGVWKRTGNGTTMVSPPEVHYRETTLTLPLVTVSGRGPLDGRTLVRRNGSSAPKYPNASAGFRNPLSRAEVNLTVGSEYYRAWGSFFEQRTGGDVEYDHGNRTVTLTLVTPPSVPDVKQGVASTSSKELNIHGGGGSDTFTNSYNSSDGPYAESKNQSGTIKTVGGVSMSGGAEIRGDLVSGGGVVEIKSSKTAVEGNLSYGGSYNLKGQATVTGWVSDNGSVAEIDPVGGMVASRNESIRDDNDNGDAPISGDRLQGCASTCELTAGSYYLDEIRLTGGEDLVLNLSAGDIELAVSGPVSVDGGDVTVTNADAGRVNLYMDARTFEVRNGADVSVAPNQTSGGFRVYGPPGVDAEFSDARFVGMLYAPDSASRQGTVSVTSHASVFGALVGGETTLKSGATVHYDAALARSATLPENYQAAPHVTYMHVTANGVHVSTV